MNHYVYYSYEEWGRGYIGSRSCKCSPIEDTRYLGSFKDRSFKPTQKIILAEFPTRGEALEAEVLLHSFFEVDKNPAFANRAKQTSSSFFYRKFGNRHAQRVMPLEERQRRSEIRKGYRHSQETKDKCRESKLGAKNPRYGKPPTKGTTGMTLSPEWRKKIGESCKGKTRTPEQIERYRQAALKREAKKREQRKQES